MTRTRPLAPLRRSHVHQRCTCQRDLGVPFVSFNALTGHRSSTPEDYRRFVVTLRQGPVPVSGVFPVGVALVHLLETRLKAIQLSPYHADPPARRSLRLDTIAGFLACYFPLFTFRILGQPSDPETSPLVPAHYAGDTTLRLVARLQQPPATPAARPGRSPPLTQPADDERGRPRSNGATGSADCSMSISRSRDVCSISGTHSLGYRDVSTRKSCGGHAWARRDRFFVVTP